MNRSRRLSAASKPRGLLEAALRMFAEGANVLPANGKRPILTRWKPWQTNRQTEREIRDWFEFPNAVALACVLGPASNDLVARDFDDRRSYESWALKNPSLARELPTAATSRGTHVYFSAQGAKTTKFADGELRGHGSYVIAPPSVHRDGTAYRWINPFLRQRLLQADPSLFITDKSQEEGSGVTEKPRSGEADEIEETDAIASFSSDFSRDVLEAIQQTMPHAAGQRHHCLFNLARRLKGIPGLANASVDKLMPIFAEWHGLALAVIRTKDWDESCSEFLYAWDRIKTPYGVTPLDLAMAAARESTLTTSESMRYRSEQARLLFKLCRELQRLAGDAPFYLSCAEAEKRIGIPKMQAHRQFNRMRMEGVLELVQAHTNIRATRYRFLLGGKS